MHVDSKSLLNDTAAICSLSAPTHRSVVMAGEVNICQITLHKVPQRPTVKPGENTNNTGEKQEERLDLYRVTSRDFDMLL